MDKRQQDLLSEAKLLMLRRMPYYGIYVIGVDMIEDSSIPTAATDFFCIKFNPTWLLGGGVKGEKDYRAPRPRNEVVFVLGHEVLHMTFKHGIRMSFRDPKLWNVACDYAINLILHGEGGDDSVGTMPENDIDPKTGKPYPKLLDPQFKDMSAEQIYDILDKKRKQQGGGNKIKMPNGVVIDLSSDDPGGTGGFQGPADLTDEQLTALERDLDARASTAAASAKSQGKLPAGLERFIKSALEPIIDWRDRLRQFVAKQFPSDLSWSRPHRRYLPHDLYLPHVTKQGVGQIAVIEDTSGSINFDDPTQEGAQFNGETKSIQEDVCPEVLHLIWCDAAVAGHDKFEPGEPIVFNPKGGGGTDFRPPFKYIDDNEIPVQCAIYLTDGYGTFPDKAPPYPVLWVITSDVKAPWGETLKLTR